MERMIHITSRTVSLFLSQSQKTKRSFRIYLTVYGDVPFWQHAVSFFDWGTPRKIPMAFLCLEAGKKPSPWDEQADSLSTLPALS